MSRINKTELYLYASVWFYAVFYSIYTFTVKCNEQFDEYHDEYSDFVPGWSIFSRKRDVADYEFQTFKYLVEKLFLWVIISTILAEILRKYKYFTAIQILQTIISIVFIYTNLGVFSFTIILLQPIIFSLIPVALNKSMVWCSNALILVLISLYKYFIATEEYLIALKINEKIAYTTMLSVFWMNLRCVSFCLDFAQKPSKPSKLNFFAYCFYLPLLFCGPFIPFKDFCLESTWSFDSFTKRSTSLLMNVFRFGCWWLLVEILLHFVYINAISFHPEWIELFDSWSLYGYGYTMGQFFHLKYLIIYGLSTSFAKFEEIKVPSLPICIARVHLYSDMWKYFDAGLYNFLLNYIYLPLIKESVLSNRLFASFLCFIFVYIWHGTDDYILIWTCFNYIGIVVESLAKLTERQFLSRWKNTTLMRRVKCLLASPLLAFCVISNFYFFARTQIGNIFISNILSDSLTANLSLLIILYCCCQVSTELRMEKDAGGENEKKKSKKTKAQ